MSGLALDDGARLHLITLAVLLAVGAILLSCGGSDPVVTATDAAPAIETAPDNEAAPSTDAADQDAASADAAFPPTGNPPLLSDWRQLDISDGRLGLSEGTLPYTLNSALFSDYAHKLRTISTPDGANPAEYHDEDVFAFPVGTIITKTFYYPVAGGELQKVRAEDALTESLDLTAVHLVETRVLTHRSDGWVAFPYVWNADQTEATLARTGDLIPMTLRDAETQTEVPFTYVVPDTNQCAGCHATNNTTRVLLPIGPKARHLNRDVEWRGTPMRQLELWQAMGILGDTPNPNDLPQSPVWDDDTVPLEARARAYLDINCAHCHNRVGPADTSGLFLEPSTDLGRQLGVCKPPIAAGTGTGDRRVGISPGEPDESIFIFRMITTDPGAMMPEVGRAIIHDEGVDLMSLWISSLSGDCS